MKKLFLSAALLCGISFAGMATASTTINSDISNKVEKAIADKKPAKTLQEELQCTSQTVCGHANVFCYYNASEYWMELQWAIDDDCN